jgi:hypothetical protein
MLAVTQLASCGAGPTYLCIGRDGAVAIAAGPDDCRCPHHEALRLAADESWLRELRPSLPGNSPPSRIGSRGFDTCGCLHLELAHETAPAVERVSVSDELAQCVATTAQLPAWSQLPCPGVRRDHFGGAASLALALRAHCAATQSASVLRL